MSLKYESQVCTLASMHHKEEVIAPTFKKFLGCKIVIPEINTDLFGTFTGEVERGLLPIACAKKKCYAGLSMTHTALGIANEGSFGPHPCAPFIPLDSEVLFFTDRNLGFELVLTKMSSETNFSCQRIEKIDQLSDFQHRALFPSHGLILRPHQSKDPELIYKGIRDIQDLYRIFQICSENSADGSVWAETDMRAHMNPTRMKKIHELALEMVNRLNTPCPVCQIPGWGIVRHIQGLPCQECGAPTNLMKGQIYGCCQCNYEEIVMSEQDFTDPSHCPLCNP